MAQTEELNVENRTDPLDRFTHPDTDRILGRGPVVVQPEQINIQPEPQLQPATNAAPDFKGGNNPALDADSESGTLYVAPGDVIVACDRCGAPVATERETYDSARRDSSEIVCPVCAEKAAVSDRASRVAADRDHSKFVSVVDVYSSAPSVIVVDDEPVIANEYIPLGGGFIGGGGNGGGGGSSDSW